MINRLKNNKDNIKKIISVVMITIFIIFTFVELRYIDFKEYSKIFHDFSYFQRFSVVFFGIMAFIVSTVYDFILSKYFNLDIKKSEIFKIAFISQSFNNFISFGGLTGTKLRTELYGKNGVDTKTSIKMATAVISSGTLGIFTFIVPMFLILPESYNRFIYLLSFAVLYIPFYFLAGRINTGRFRKFTDENLPYSFLNTDVKFKLYLSSLLDWAIISIYFGFIMRSVLPEISYIKVSAVYIVSTMIGIVSFIPGGFGSFDLSVLYFFGKLGFSHDKVLLALLLYRISYYIIPWFIGVLIYISEQFNAKKDRIIQSQEKVAGILSTLIFISGVILIISTATPAMINRIKFLNRIMPEILLYYTKEITLLIGIILIIMSRGIKLRIRKVYKFSMILLILGAFSCIIKGLDYEEAIILIGFAVLLYYTRNLYTRDHVEIKSSDISRLGFIFIVAIFAFTVIYNRTHEINIYTSQEAISFYWIENNGFKISVFFILSGIIITMLLYSRKDFIVFEDISENDIDKYRKFLNKYKGNYFTHLFFMRDKNVFYNSKNSVMMLYRPYKDNIIVLGDPIGESDDFEEAIDEIIEFASSHDMKVCFYEVAGENLEIYANQGFGFIKIGEDATVVLDDFTYDGKKNKNLRKSHNKLDGVNFSFELVKPPFSEDFINDIKRISDGWLGGKSELSFSMGAFKEEYLSEAPIAVLRNCEGKIIVFATIQPVVNSDSITIDLMRYDRKKCDSNEMLLMFLGLIDMAKENEFKYFYLGMAPLSNVGGKKYSGTKEKAIKLVYDYGDKFYSFRGLRYFKEKFHPEWKGRYIVYKNDAELVDVMFSIYSLVHKN